MCCSQRRSRCGDGGASNAACARRAGTICGGARQRPTFVPSAARYDCNMHQHPPTEQGALSKRFWPWRAIVIIICCAALLAIAWVLLTRPPTVYARSPSVSPDPTGIVISFDKGRWTNAVLQVNGTFTCDVGVLGPGEHVLAWNRFQGGGAGPLNLAMVKSIALRGDVDGKQRAIEYTVQSGPGFTATSWTTDD